jgi:hypothetical protein
MFPETNYSKHARKANMFQRKMDAIETKYPDIDFRSLELRKDFELYWKMQRELIYEIVDAKMCKDNHPRHLCSDCNCWKHAFK